MSLLDDVVSTLDLQAEVRDIRQGVFHTGVLTRYCGLAASLPRDALRQTGPLVRGAGSLVEKSPVELVSMAYSNSILEAAIGVATINSLLVVNLEGCIELNARDLIADKGEKKKIAIVGHFPFINQLQSIAEKVWVIEKNPLDGDFGEEKAENLIPEADVVAITGTAVTNHTLEDLLALCSREAFIVILGDSTPMSPVLFDYGIDAVSGTRVTEPELALRCVSEGANFRQIRGTRRLTMLK